MKSIEGFWQGFYLLDLGQDVFLCFYFHFQDVELVQDQGAGIVMSTQSLVLQKVDLQIFIWEKDLYAATKKAKD